MPLAPKAQTPSEHLQDMKTRQQIDREERSLRDLREAGRALETLTRRLAKRFDAVPKGTRPQLSKQDLEDLKQVEKLAKRVRDLQGARGMAKTPRPCQVISANRSRCWRNWARKFGSNPNRFHAIRSPSASSRERRASCVCRACCAQPISEAGPFVPVRSSPSKVQCSEVCRCQTTVVSASRNVAAGCKPGWPPAGLDWVVPWAAARFWRNGPHPLKKKTPCA
ncbi:hypothetical protein [Chloracidobacterium thermophilum]|uniref:hypothetical protein n=1 Tax=Chloracidobacterium thermophilum TaxID=458033 RepID=UPI0020182020|nr:hypothetical protein [Chloracidobacterium thermophilum]